MDDQALPLNPYSIYPDYYYYLNFISSEKVPVLNYAFESYLRKETTDPRQGFISQIMGLGDEEKANRLLDGQSLKELIVNNDDPAALNNVLKSKGSYLLSYIQKNFGEKDFDTFLINYFYDESFKTINFDDFTQLIKEEFNIDLETFVDDWYYGKEIPAFLTSEMDMIQTVKDNQVVYLAKIKVSNTSNVDGLVKFTTRSGGGEFRGFMGGGASSESADERVFLIEANTTKEIQMLYYEQPRGINMSTMISKNIPASISFFSRNSEEIENYKAVDYVKVLDKPIENTVPGEIIVDNTSEGFSIHDPSGDNPIKKLFLKEEEQDNYVGMGFGRSPATWSLTARSNFYGNYVHSARFIRNGDGTKSVSWETPLPKAGYYDIYVYLIRDRGRGRNRGNSGVYNYTVYHEDGVEEIPYDLSDTDEGWNLLGNFYLADSGKVVLSDKSDAQRVIADAVKWVRETK